MVSRHAKTFYYRNFFESDMSSQSGPTSQLWAYIPHLRYEIEDKNQRIFTRCQVTNICAKGFFLTPTGSQNRTYPRQIP